MSNYPHSAILASSLGTSPFAVQNSLESLINRSRTNPHPHRRGDSNASAPHSPTSLHAHLPPDLTFTAASPDGRNDDDINGSGTRDRRRSSGYVHRPAFTTIREVSYDEGAAILLHDDDDDDNEDNERTGLMRDSGRGSNRRDTRRKSYGATTSEPITVRAGRNRRPSDQITSEAPRASGNSRSRSKARTPPRSDPAPHMISEPSSVNTDDTALLDDHPSPALEDIDARIGGRDDYRGRAVESRPLSPVSTKHSESASGYTRAGRRLSVSTRFADDSSGDEGGDVARGIVATGGGAVFGGRAGLGMTPATSSLPGGGPGVVNTGIGIMDLDPAEELDAVDLELPVAEDGTEARNWVDAVKVEIPIIFKMSLPCLFTQLAEWSLVLASVVSIGHLGTAQLAASSLASMTASVSAFSILQGLATSLDTLLPAAWTSSDPSRVGLWTQRQAVVMVFAMIPMFVLWWNIEGVLIFLNQEADVAHLAADYLRYLSFGIPGYGGNVIAKKYLQAQGLMNVPTYVLFIIAPLNLVFNWLFVWGPKGIRLGFVGGAVATALSYNLTFVMLLVYILFYGPREAFYPWSFSSSFSKLGTVTSLGLAGTIMLSSEWWAWEACALAASLLGPTNLAAQSVLLSTASTFYQFPASLGIASAVRCGNLLGAGRGWEAKWASRASFFLSLFLAGSSSTILLIFRKNWGYLFNSDPEVVAIVATVLPYIALFQLTDGIVATAGSVLRALGLHTTGAMINLTSYYIIGLPLGIWLTFTPRYHLGLQGIWIGLSLALGYGSILSAVLVWRADWTRAVERVRERLGLGTRGEIGQDGKWEEEQPVNFGSDEEEYMEDGEAERRLARRASRSSRRRSIKTSIYRGQHGSKSPENGHASAQERRRLLQDGDGDADGE